MNQILCIALALFVGLLSSRLMKVFRLPNVTGYLLAGVIFGPYVLGQYIGGWSIDNPETSINAIKWISDVALGFIAFTIGCSFKKEAIQRIGKKIVVITLAEALGGAIVTIGALFIAHIFLKEQLPISLILTFGAIACATAPAATLMVIKQYKATGPVVDTLIPVVAFDDAVALIAFAILFSISKALAGNTAINVMDFLVWPLVEIATSLVLGAALGFGITLGFRFFKSRANRSILIICAIFIVLGLSMLSDHYGWKVSISSLLACMMIGSIFVNFRSDAGRTIERIDGITPPLYMLFFVISGASLDITIFASKGALVLLAIALTYVVGRCVGKWSGAYFSSKAVHSEPTVQKYLGFTLFPQAGVAIGLATTANQAFTDPHHSSMVLAVVLTATIIYELVGPVITKIALKKAGEIKE